MNQQVDPVLANRLGMGVPLLDCQNKLLLFIPRLLDSILRDDCRRTQRIVHHLLGFGHNNIQMRVTLEALGVDLIDVLGAGGPTPRQPLSASIFRPRAKKSAAPGRAVSADRLNFSAGAVERCGQDRGEG